LRSVRENHRRAIARRAKLSQRRLIMASVASTDQIERPETGSLNLKELEPLCAPWNNRMRIASVELRRAHRRQ